MKESVNHPEHYNNNLSGIECIEMIHMMSFNIGNAFKYIYRRNHKDDVITDLKKAKWYIVDELKRRKERKYKSFISTGVLFICSFFRQDIYDFYRKNINNLHIVNRYEENLLISRIYDLLNQANFYFYDIDSLSNILVYIDFIISMEETKKTIKTTK